MQFEGRVLQRSARGRVLPGKGGDTLVTLVVRVGSGEMGKDGVIVCSMWGGVSTWGRECGRRGGVRLERISILPVD
eukprot:768476-Hanusia_phi.AAC.8